MLEYLRYSAFIPKVVIPQEIYGIIYCKCNSFGGLAPFGWRQFIVFLVLLPVTKLRHMMTTPINLVLEPRERPKGAMRPVPNLMEATDIETIGAARVGEFTWKQLFDTDACTICGRCTSVCPANITGKPLDPREIVLKLGEVADRTAADPVSPPVSVDGEITVTSDLVFERITRHAGSDAPVAEWADRAARLSCDDGRARSVR